MSYDDFEYDYFSTKELSNLLAEGEGSFTIMQVVPKNSKAGNAMLVVTFSVTDTNGKALDCIEYLIRGNDEASKKRLATKIKNIANAINKPGLYAEGVKLKPHDLLGYKGKCLIRTQDGGGDYPDKSVISKYISAIVVEQIDHSKDLVEDEVPF